eukprot:jgi/Mesvir1/11095/Mv02465-RA.1
MFSRSSGRAPGNAKPPGASPVWSPFVPTKGLLAADQNANANRVRSFPGDEAVAASGSENMPVWQRSQNAGSASSDRMNLADRDELLRRVAELEEQCAALEAERRGLEADLAAVADDREQAAQAAVEWEAETKMEQAAAAQMKGRYEEAISILRRDLADVTQQRDALSARAREAAASSRDELSSKEALLTAALNELEALKKEREKERSAPVPSAAMAKFQQDKAALEARVAAVEAREAGVARQLAEAQAAERAVADQQASLAEREKTVEAERAAVVGAKELQAAVTKQLQEVEAKQRALDVRTMQVSQREAEARAQSLALLGREQALLSGQDTVSRRAFELAEREASLNAQGEGVQAEASHVQAEADQIAQKQAALGELARDLEERSQQLALRTDEVRRREVVLALLREKETELAVAEDSHKRREGELAARDAETASHKRGLEAREVAVVKREEDVAAARRAMQEKMEGLAQLERSLELRAAEVANLEASLEARERAVARAELTVAAERRQCSVCRKEAKEIGRGSFAFGWLGSLLSPIRRGGAASAAGTPEGTPGAAPSPGTQGKAGGQGKAGERGRATPMARGISGVDEEEEEGVFVTPQGTGQLSSTSKKRVRGSAARQVAADAAATAVASELEAVTTTLTRATQLVVTPAGRGAVMGTLARRSSSRLVTRTGAAGVPAPLGSPAAVSSPRDKMERQGEAKDKKEEDGELKEKTGGEDEGAARVDRRRGPRHKAAVESSLAASVGEGGGHKDRGKHAGKGPSTEPMAKDSEPATAEHGAKGAKKAGGVKQAGGAGASEDGAQPAPLTDVREGDAAVDIETEPGPDAGADGAGTQPTASQGDVPPPVPHSGAPSHARGHSPSPEGSPPPAEEVTHASARKRARGDSARKAVATPSTGGGRYNLRGPHHTEEQGEGAAAGHGHGQGGASPSQSQASEGPATSLGGRRPKRARAVAAAVDMATPTVATGNAATPHPRPPRGSTSEASTPLPLSLRRLGLSQEVVSALKAEDHVRTRRSSHHP